jgi:hypothetical protein
MIIRRFLLVLIVASVTTSAGCASGSYAAKGASQGATTGAVAGAVGGMMTALIFGGNVANAGARGAVYGGTTGAVVGGMSGSRVDQAAAEQKQAERQKEIERFKKEVGPDAFNGVVALAECKHEIAIANAREAVKSKNANHSLAGVWVQILTEADRKNDAKARALYPELISRDREVKSDADAESRMREALQEVHSIRQEYDLPVECAG